MTSVHIALLQFACSEDRERNVERTVDRIRRAAAAGANIICLPELFDVPYFPQRTAIACRTLAHRLPSKTARTLQELAGALGTVLIVPVFEEAQPGLLFNTTLVIDADGTCAGTYRKTHIPNGMGYFEKYYFTPGNLGYPVFDTQFGRIAVGICYDQWFPEVARIFALQGAQLVFYPSAIGTEPDRPGYSSAGAWQTVMQAHAITNGIFVAAVNRVGAEGEMVFYGKSFVCDPFGAILAQAGEQEEILAANIDFGKIHDMRDVFHFLRDRRPATYTPLLQQIIES